MAIETLLMCKAKGPLAIAEVQLHRPSCRGEECNLIRAIRSYIGRAQPRVMICFNVPLDHGFRIWVLDCRRRPEKLRVVAVRVSCHTEKSILWGSSNIMTECAHLRTCITYGRCTCLGYKVTALIVTNFHRDS